MLITVLNIMVAITLPLWSGMIQRDKEEELISRGLQYAEAIRVFQRRFGRLPVQLDELIKVEPRSSPRLWEDPMTGKADWVLILEGSPQGKPGIDPQTGQPLPPATPDPQDSSALPDGETPPQPVGLIRGVRARATGEGFHVFLDQTSFSSWEFLRSDIFSRFRTAPSENGIPRVLASTLGRPFRYGIPGGVQNPGGPGSPAPFPKPSCARKRTVRRRRRAIRPPRAAARRPDLPLAPCGRSSSPAPATGGSAGADLRAGPRRSRARPRGSRSRAHRIQRRDSSGPAGLGAAQKSRLAAQFGLTLLNSPGTIDSNYRGEVRVLLVNLGSEPFAVRRGERRRAAGCRAGAARPLHRGRGASPELARRGRIRFDRSRLNSAPGPPL